MAKSHAGSLAAFLSKLTSRYWPLFLVATIILSVLSIPRTIHLFKTISTDPIDLLPTDNPNIQSLLAIRNKLEKGIRVSLIFESEDPANTIKFMKDTSAKLRQHPLVGNVIDRKIGYDFFNEHKLMYLELDDLHSIHDKVDRRIQHEKLKGLYIDFEDEEESSFEEIENEYRSRYTEDSSGEYNVSRDGLTYSILIDSKTTDTSLAQASLFQDAMEAFVKTLRPTSFHPSMKVYFYGSTKVLEYRALMKDLRRVGLISGILIFIPLLIRFRNPLYVLVIFTPLLLGLPISFAAASFFIPKLNVSTSFLFAILGGLGIENGIHIFSRYWEERCGKVPRLQAIQGIFEKTGRAILTSIASVAITFLLLTINDFRGFSDFGLIAGLGLWIIFAVYFTFFPSLLLFLEKLTLLRPSLKGLKKEWTVSIKPTWLKGSLIFFLFFSLFSFVSVPFLQFEYDSKKTQADIPEVRLAKQKQRMTIRRVNNPAAVIIQEPQEAEGIESTVQQIVANDKSTPTIDTVRSYFDLVPSNQTEKLKVIAQIQKLLADPTLRLVKDEKKEDLDRAKETFRQANPVEWKEVPNEVIDLFAGRKEVPGSLLYINAIPEMELDDGRNAIRFAEDVAMLHTKTKTYHPSSDAIVFGLVLKTMLADSKKVLAISILSIFFFIFLDFRKFKKSVLVFLPILLGVFWLLGIMLFFQIKFNFYNMIIIPAVMGISIDNAIHIFHRYEELGRGSMPKVLSSTGVAALLASLTNASGFFGLLFCVHKGLYSIGLLAVIGVATCLISTLVFLPALLQFLEHIRYDKKFVVP